MSKLSKSRKMLPAASHSQLLALINNLDDGFFALNASGIITLTNDGALKFLETDTLSDGQQISALNIIDKNGYPIDLQRLVLSLSVNFTNRDWRLRYKDGKTVGVQINASPAPEGFVLLVRDITLEKNLEAERDEFISVASHELRTPIAIAEGSVSNARLLAQRGKVATPIQHSLTAAHQQILFVSSLINDLAMLSRANQEGTIQTIETFAATDILETLLRDYGPQAAQKHLTLSSHVADGLSLVTTSRLYLQEILQNFLTNAIKYTQKGDITLAASQIDGGVRFSVTDTGIGVSPDEQTKIFNKFYRGEDWRVREASGAGLGLYVAAKLAELIGAKIELRSQPNKGSIFSLDIPSLENSSIVK